MSSPHGAIREDVACHMFPYHLLTTWFQLLSSSHKLLRSCDLIRDSVIRDYVIRDSGGILRSPESTIRDSVIRDSVIRDSVIRVTLRLALICLSYYYFISKVVDTRSRCRSPYHIALRSQGHIHDTLTHFCSTANPGVYTLQASLFPSKPVPLTAWLTDRISRMRNPRYSSRRGSNQGPQDLLA